MVLPAPSLRRRRLLQAAALAPLPVLAACSLLDPTPTLRFGQDELQQQLQTRFPIDRTLLELFEVSVRTPRLRLLPERNRLGSVVDLQVRDRVFGATWTGRLDFDTELRWQRSDQSLRLAQVRVIDLAVDNASAGTRSAAERLGAALAERVLEDLVLWRLTGERAAQAERRGLEPGEVRVTRSGVEVTLVPRPR
jgi:hypothetical protein